tara:strand:+ start:104 stop:418 length:315 start_codon:yes stop_codon:yes gene_type:complete
MFTSASSSKTFSTILRISFGLSLPATFFKIKPIKVCSSSPICSILFCTSQALNFFSIRLDFSNNSQLILNSKSSSLRFGINVMIFSSFFETSSGIYVILKSAIM